MGDKEDSDDRSSLSVNPGVESSGSINPDAQNRKRRSREPLPLDEYMEGILSGNRTVLSRAITLVESTRAGDRERAQEIVEACLPHSGESVRIGITGVPGVGKSTFIERLGSRLAEAGHTLAVLAIDPSSTRTRGSILGDKTRMDTLASNPAAYVRPSPTGGSLGGVARKTRETICLCEAAGYDTILIETVGVGQSETAVHSMVDLFLLLMLAGAGDELQGIKRGIVEMADLITINKTDESQPEAVQQAVREYRNALRLYPEPDSGWPPQITTCSALTGDGIGEVWEMVEDYFETVRENGFFRDKRIRQARHWMDETVRQQLTEQFYSDPAVAERYEELERAVTEGEITSFRAAKLLLETYNSRR